MEYDPYEIKLRFTPKGNWINIIENNLTSLSAFETSATHSSFGKLSYSLRKTENSDQLTKSTLLIQQNLNM
jgi:hypothetical protein